MTTTKTAHRLIAAAYAGEVAMPSLTDDRNDPAFASGAMTYRPARLLRFTLPDRRPCEIEHRPGPLCHWFRVRSVDGVLNTGGLGRTYLFECCSPSRIGKGLDRILKIAATCDLSDMRAMPLPGDPAGSVLECRT
jgi:hypothetical protein